MTSQRGRGPRDVMQSAVKIDQQNDTGVETAAGLCPSWIMPRCQGNSEGEGKRFPKMVLNTWVQCKETNLNPCLTPHASTRLRWTQT